jgi:hypothetical protein
VKILVFLYYPEDKGRKLLLNIGTYMPVWMISYPRRWSVQYIVYDKMSLLSIHKYMSMMSF